MATTFDGPLFHATCNITIPNRNTAGQRCALRRTLKHNNTLCLMVAHRKLNGAEHVRNNTFTSPRKFIRFPSHLPMCASAREFMRPAAGVVGFLGRLEGNCDGCGALFGSHEERPKISIGWPPEEYVLDRVRFDEMGWEHGAKDIESGLSRMKMGFGELRMFCATWLIPSSPTTNHTRNADRVYMRPNARNAVRACPPKEALPP
jgi:hypothetical protein